MTAYEFLNLTLAVAGIRAIVRAIQDRARDGQEAAAADQRRHAEVMLHLGTQACTLEALIERAAQGPTS